MRKATGEEREQSRLAESTAGLPSLIIDNAATDEQRAALLRLDDITVRNPLVVKETAEAIMEGPINPKVQRLLREEARDAETAIMGVLALRADLASEYDEETETAIQADETFKSLRNQDRQTPHKISTETAEKLRAENEKLREKRRLLRIGIYAGRVAAFSQKIEKPEKADQSADVA